MGSGGQDMVKSVGNVRLGEEDEAQVVGPNGVARRRDELDRGGAGVEDGVVLDEGTRRTDETDGGAAVGQAGGGEAVGADPVELHSGPRGVADFHALGGAGAD